MLFILQNIIFGYDFTIVGHFFHSIQLSGDFLRNKVASISTEIYNLGWLKKSYW